MPTEFTQKTLEPVGKVLLDIAVESDLGLKTPLVFRTIKLLQRHGYLPAYGFTMAEVCLEEALANAFVHGNKLDRNKQVRLIVFGDGDRWGVIVQDQGAGLKPENIPDPNDPENLLKERGRGVLLMNHYMESVQYYSRGGTTLRMMRTKQTEPEPGSTPPAKAPEYAELPADGAIMPVEVQAAIIEDAPSRVALPDEITLEASAQEVEDEIAEQGPLTITQQGNISVATVHCPRITEDSAESIRVPLMELANKGPRLVMDMTRVEFMSSIGIASIMAVYKAVVAKKGKMAFACVCPAVQNIFKATGLLRLFVIEPTVEAAGKKIG